MPDDLTVRSESGTFELFRQDEENIFIGNIELSASGDYSVFMNLNSIEITINDVKILPVVLSKEIHTDYNIIVKKNTVSFIILELDLNKSLIYTDGRYYLLPSVNVKEQGIRL